MQKYFLYIGSNNNTHELEKEKACEIVSSAFDGFSAYEIIGYWKGAQEKTLKIEIVSDDQNDAKIARICKVLAKELQQDAIMMESFNSNVAFIQK